jgi:hypothetical protein
MHDGELWERATPVLPTREIESGFWQTPTKVTGEHPGRVKIKPHQQDCLSAQVNRTPACQYWPTPRAGNPGSRPNGKGGKILAEEVAIAEGLRERGVKKFPTPTASMVTMADMEQARFAGNGGKRPDYATFATPKSRDWKGQSQQGIHAPGDALPNMDRGDGKPVGGSLNPTWVEWLMGWPLGWTDCDAPETDRFQQWLRSHGAHSQADCDAERAKEKS